MPTYATYVAIFFRCYLLVHSSPLNCVFRSYHPTYTLYLHYCLSVDFIGLKNAILKTFHFIMTSSFSLTITDILYPSTQISSSYSYTNLTISPCQLIARYDSHIHAAFCPLSFSSSHNGINLATCQQQKISA